MKIKNKRVKIKVVVLEIFIALFIALFSYAVCTEDSMRIVMYRIILAIIIPILIIVKNHSE